MGDTFALVGLIFCGLILIACIILGVWVLTHKPSTLGASCSVDGQCSPTENCTNGHCTEITCNKASDCTRGGQICSNGYCYQLSCEDSTDCGPKAICAKNECVPYGMMCSSDSQCWNDVLSCINIGSGGTGSCYQCETAEDCAGQGGICAGGICVGSCTTGGTAGNCGGGQICLSNNGVCCPSNASYNKSCDSKHPCSASDQFCVNGSCSCQPGDVGDLCVSNNDCSSANCIIKTINNITFAGICGAIGATCVFNYTDNPNSIYPPNAYCPTPQAPYCSNGSCSSNPEGAPCSCWKANPGNTGNDPNCTIYNACNITGTPGTGTTSVTGGTANPTILYCVNSICSSTPGSAGDKCTTPNDCIPISSGLPICQNSGPGTTSKICQ